MNLRQKNKKFLHLRIQKKLICLMTKMTSLLSRKNKHQQNSQSDKLHLFHSLQPKITPSNNKRPHQNYLYHQSHKLLRKKGYSMIKKKILNLLQKHLQNQHLQKFNSLLQLKRKICLMIKNKMHLLCRKSLLLKLKKSLQLRKTYLTVINKIFQ